MQEINGNNFYNEVIKPSYDRLILVEFWAPWCGPCHGLMQTFNEIEKSGKYPLLFAKLNVDEYTDTALDQKVMGLPHTKIFASGFPIDSFSDPMSRHEVELWIKAALMTPYILQYSHFYDLDIPVEQYVRDLEEALPHTLHRHRYSLLLAKYYLVEDPAVGKEYLESIPDESEYFEDKLLLRDLFPLMELEYQSDPTDKKLWSARNALSKRNYESAYQFILQASRIDASSPNDVARMALLAFRQYLGEDHELNRKYQSQFDQVTRIH